jgi:hypothetical protein
LAVCMVADRLPQTAPSSSGLDEQQQPADSWT